SARLPANRFESSPIEAALNGKIIVVRFRSRSPVEHRANGRPGSVEAAERNGQRLHRLHGHGHIARKRAARYRARHAVGSCEQRRQVALNVTELPKVMVAAAGLTVSSGTITVSCCWVAVPQE
nr:hypothetical protein [Tanacetum cinerariifolium]